MAIAAKNHYVPQAYLSRFAVNGKLQVYRMLVEHEGCPIWQPRSPSAVAYFPHLYTAVDSGSESDEIERWMDREIESPASRVIDRVTTRQRLWADDWRVLVRFLAAQYLRTAAYFQRFMIQQNQLMPGILAGTRQNVHRRLQEETDEAASAAPCCEETRQQFVQMPMRVDMLPEGETVQVKLQVLIGRGSYLYELERMLTSTWRILLKHRWTILEPNSTREWFTSDDPVLQLNYLSSDDYNFGGGWDSPGTEIMLPLSPKHLLYTQIGARVPTRGSVLSDQGTQLIRRVLARHAHRAIYASSQVADVEKLRARHVDSKRHEIESLIRQGFHDEQKYGEWEWRTRPADLTKKKN